MKKFPERIVPSVAAVAAVICILTTSATTLRAAAPTDCSDTSRHETVIAALSADNEVSYTLTVDGAEESHRFGDVIQLSAPFYVSDGLAHRFSHWTGDTSLLADTTDPDASFAMPQSAVTLCRNYIIVGDVDEDGMITAADALYIRKMAEGVIRPTFAADINLDGRWDSEDRRLIGLMLVEAYTPTK